MNSQYFTSVDNDGLIDTVCLQYLRDQAYEKRLQEARKEEDEEFKSVKQLIKELSFIYDRTEFLSLKKTTIEKLEKDGYNVIHKIDPHGFDDGYIVSWKKEKPSKLKCVLKIKFFGQLFT